jgi:hypothetical protein
MMAESGEPVRRGESLEESMLGEGGQVAMPNLAAESRGEGGGPEDQEVAEQRAADDRRRMVEGYVRPGEAATDRGA